MKTKLNRETVTKDERSADHNSVPLTALKTIANDQQHRHQQRYSSQRKQRRRLGTDPARELNNIMQQAYKTRTSDAALADHLRQIQKIGASRANYNQESTQPTTPLAQRTTTSITPTPSQTTTATTTDIYVIGGNGSSNPPTMDRKQHNRQSWVNMRRNGELAASSAAASVTSGTVMPSPQTSRSYVSTTSVTGANSGVGVGIAGGGSASCRTTSASGRASTSGVHTISGSSNTLNDIISDFHSQELGSSSDYHFTATSSASPAKNLSSNGSFNVANGSTVKLLSTVEDEKNQQTKCSIFRGLMLCICLNVTYANIVRFPRELDKYGSAYLIPYVVLLFLVGLPIILLEISIGQFLGQGAAHTWRASPIFKGACIVSRFASWLSTIWVSLQAVLAVAYIGMFAFKTVPFSECIGDIKLAHNGYKVIGNSGQECLQKTFLTPFWENPLYFGLLSIGLICLWIVVMLCTHNGKMLRRSLFFFGFVGFVLLCTITGWEVHNSLERTYFPELWPYDPVWLLNSNIWFSALMQVLFATNCGFGALPMLTGKFLYKGDAVRTSIVYLCFNLLINAIAVTLFMVQFDVAANGGNLMEELKPMTAIYDRILYDTPSNPLWAKLIPALIFTLIVISALISLMVAIYTCTRLVPRHPNYVIGLIALVMTIVSLSAPKFAIARLLDSRLVGTLVITALVFELIATTWIYGAKNIYTDLEFSIGRPILKSWMALWCFCPVLLTGVLVWWCADDDQYDLMAEYVPRWAPILFVLGVVFLIACILIFRQVEYNFFGMICEAAKSAKEWGPADPLARHAWKQWRSVCQDTGRRDFTLRRRGTRDYTHSIKKGQYSSSAKYANGQVAGNTQWKSSTPGNSSPNYSGSMYGDSAIEEDISVDKYPGITQQQFVPFQTNDGKPLRYSHRSRTQQRVPQQQQQHQQQQLQNNIERLPTTDKHREVVYIRRLSDEGHHATRIEITPSNESITYGGVARNPLAKPTSNGHATTHVKRSSSSSALPPQRNFANAHTHGGLRNGTLPPPAVPNGNGDHICWRKFSVNTHQEYSTEL